MKRTLERGLEPDLRFWIANEFKVRGRTDLNFDVDPLPDLFIEIETRRTILDRLSILSVLGISEVWRYDGTALHVGLLQSDGQYLWGDKSPSFPAIPISELARFLELAQGTDHLSILRAFREWARDKASS